MATEKERARLERVRELEAMVHKLTMENEKLLTQVQPPLPSRDEAEEKSSSSHLSSPGEKLLEEQRDVEEGVLALSDVEETEEDEWLYVSPARPPTPKQKTFTPTEWLSGEAKSGRGAGEKEVPSLDEVRKALASTMDEAERFISSPSGRTNSRLQPCNKTAKKYLDRVRQRRRSPLSESEESSPGSLSPADPRSHSPLLAKKQRNIPARPLFPHGVGRRQPEAMSPPNPPSSSPSSLKVNWTPRPSAVSYKAGKVPEEGASQGINPLKIQWDPSKAVASDEDEESQQLESLKVNWTARMPKEDEEEEAVPVVKWNPRQVPENGKPQQLESLKVNWTARMPKEDDEDEEEEAVPVVKWNTRQVPENGKPQSHHTQAEESEEEEVPKVVWKVRNVSEVQTKSRTGQVQKRTVASPDNTNASLLKVNWTPPTQRTPADNPLKIRWNPNMASLSSSEEDISSQRNLDAAGSQEDEEKEPPHRLSRYAAHVASQPVIPPATTTSSGLLGRRTSPANYTGRPVASVSPLQKGTGTGLRQPSPARSSLPAPSPSALKPTSGQIVPAAVRSRSLSPSQRGQDNFKGGSSQLRQPSPSQVSNGNGDQSPSQSRLRSPGQHGGSLGRKAGMRIYQPLTSQSTGRGSTQYAVRTERPSIISPQSSPTPKQPSPVLQQRKLTPVGIARPNNQDSSSGIRQPVSHRRPGARGNPLHTSPAQPTMAGKEEWLEGCF